MQYFTPIHEPNQQILIVTCINRNWIVCVCVCEFLQKKFSKNGCWHGLV